MSLENSHLYLIVYLSSLFHIPSLNYFSFFIPLFFYLSIYLSFLLLPPLLSLFNFSLLSSSLPSPVFAFPTSRNKQERKEMTRLYFICFLLFFFHCLFYGISKGGGGGGISQVCSNSGFFFSLSFVKINMFFFFLYVILPIS